MRNSIGMTRGSVLQVEDGQGLLVSVWHGEIWLTQEGDHRDYLLTTGRSLRLDRGGAALAHAMRRSVVTLAAPGSEPYARSVQLARAGCKAPIVLYDAGTTPRSAGRGIGPALRRLWSGLFAPHARPTTASL